MSGLTLTKQQPADADLRVTLDGSPPGAVYERLTSGETFLDLLRQAALERLVQITPTEAGYGHHASLLYDDGVTALGGSFATVVADIVAPGETSDLSKRVVRSFGTSNHPLCLHQPFEALADGPVPLFARASVTPTIAVTVTKAFIEQDTRQRRKICQLLVSLADGCDVQLVASAVRQSSLRQYHRDDLPCFGERCDRPQDIEGLVAAAADVVTPTGTRGRILELLSESESDARAQRRLVAETGKSDSHVSNLVSELEDLQLVERYQRLDGKAVTLSAAGRQFVEEEIATQRRLDADFGESGHCLGNSRVSPTALGEGGDGQADPDRRGGSPVDVEYLPGPERAAVAAGAEDGAISLCNQSLPQWERTGHGWPAPRRSFRPERSELVVAAEWQGCLQWMVSITRSLANPGTLGRVLTDDRLDEGEFGMLLDGYVETLRDALCLGYLSKEVQSAADYREFLGQAYIDLLEKTRHLKQTDDEEKERELRRTILKAAHGLCGTVTHLCKLAGVTVIREVRMPECSRDFKERDHEEFLTTLTSCVRIGSVIGSHYAGNRQMFEGRDDKRQAAPEAEIDAADPFGRLVGSIVIVGDGVETLADPIREAFDDLEPHEDAPETAIRVPVLVGHDREWAAETAARIATQKNYRVTPAAVTTLRALTEGPLDIAEGLWYGLQKETDGDRMDRDLRADEVRRALASLPDGRICPEIPRSASRVVQALCRANQTLTTAELTEAADVSAKSLRRHREKLAALGLVKRVDAGWRLTLSFADEPGDRYPDAVHDEWTLTDAYFELAHAHYDAEAYVSGETALLSLLFGGETASPGELEAESPWHGAWDELARRLTVDDRLQQVETVEAALGTEPEQAALPGVGA